MELVKVCAFALMGVLLHCSLKVENRNMAFIWVQHWRLWYFPAPFPIWDRQKNS